MTLKRWFTKKPSQTTGTVRPTFRSAEPIGRGTITAEYIQALKEVGADPKLIAWAEARRKPESKEAP